MNAQFHLNSVAGGLVGGERVVQLTLLFFIVVALLSFVRIYSCLGPR